MGNPSRGGRASPLAERVADTDSLTRVETLRRHAVSPSDVFVNVPFDSQHETLFLALIAGLVALGLNPRCVLEVPPSTDRLRRLYNLVRACPFSIHDLSRVQLSSRPFRVPRFNMPFELGLAAAIAFESAQRTSGAPSRGCPFD